MEKRGFKKGFRPLAEMTSPVLDPILRKRAGLSIQLLECWPEIAGADIAETTRPLKIAWPRRPAGEGAFAPGTLVIACEGFSAMKVQHENDQLIQRINVFFGYTAIARLRIEQKPVRPACPPLADRPGINAGEKDRLEQMTAAISNDALRRALFSLGAGVLGSQIRKQGNRT